jgi:hypothetical protein
MGDYPVNLLSQSNAQPYLQTGGGTIFTSKIIIGFGRLPVNNKAESFLINRINNLSKGGVVAL